jgi:glycosyltransferase involved in cell wall biosynthesis
MFLLDAIYINNSGGKVLLDFLVQELEKQKVVVHYLFDERIRDHHSEILHNRVTYLEASLLKRHQFYKAQEAAFSKILCFGNLPPSLRMEATVYTYFHQKLFLDIPKDTPFKQHVFLKVKTAVFRFLHKNTDFWMVQTELVKADFLKKMRTIAPEKVLVLPFYPSVSKKTSKESVQKGNNFIYVSNAGAHKNHFRLIEGFKIFYDQYKTGQLTLTIGKEHSDLIARITKLQEAAYPIINVGFVAREDLVYLYNANNYLIFPSLTESFGLGLLEAMEQGCKVVGADLPYTHAVCNASVVFDPYNIQSIANAFSEAVTKNNKETEQLVFNEIDAIIQILKS